ncbi:MAG: LPS-assembly protein LptD [Deltaproteobacteria bacterium]|nr:LPS-assembly protein LptD [Deltaproteobacteria bacterium]
MFFKKINLWFFFFSVLISHFLFFFTHGVSFSENGIQLSSKLPVYIDADSITYDREKNTYYANGNVIVTQEGSTIRASKMAIDMLESLGTAEGNVELTDEGGNVLKGDRLDFNIDTKTGTVKNGRMFYKKQNVHISGSEINKVGEESYNIRNGAFTTCDCKEDESPAWKFSASKADVIVGQYMNARNVFLHINDKPVLYSPYLVLPVKRERQTGFLFPKFGYSELRGFKMDNAFFWAISDNTDATFYLDVEAKRGLGKGGEYRYTLSNNTKGQFYVYQFQEDDIDRVRQFRSGSSNLSKPQTASDNRWILKLKHDQTFPDNITLKVDINRVSDDEFFIDFAKDKKVDSSEYFTDFSKGLTGRSLESLESNISLNKRWDRFNLNGQFRYFDNLLSADDDTVLQKLPEITLTGTNQQVIKTPFYFSLESSFVNFQRDRGTKGQRLDIHPRISLPLTPDGYFEFTPSIGYRETLWWVDNMTGHYYDRGIYDLQADLTTTFVRIYALDGKEQKLKHTIRPKITYTYIPDDDQTSLPSFDDVDRITRSNTFNYSVNTILTSKFSLDNKTYTRDVVYLDIKQSYDINEATRDLSSSTDKRKPFSDVTLETILKPFDWMSASWKRQYDVYDNWFEKQDTSFGISSKRGDNLNLSYRYIRNDVEYLDAGARFKATDTVDLTYNYRYSYSGSKGIETEYGVDYHKQCWGVSVTFTDKLEEKLFMVTFNLLGLGQVGGISGGMK